MCGISALFASTSNFPADQLVLMNNVIAHRGPDDEGFLLIASIGGQPLAYGGKDTPSNVKESKRKYCPKRDVEQLKNHSIKVGLGHRRLSIVDLSPAGHQPMCTPDEKLWITFNGEIYNFQEIRAELQNLGIQFFTQSDTEVILQAYRQWGRECLQRFNGMFAFVIYDSINSQFFAARDRFGVKPLYYWLSPQGVLAFASEIKQFTVLEGWGAKANSQRAYDFLNWGMIDHTSETLFHSVSQLRGGEYLEMHVADVSKEKLKPKKWYCLPSTPFSGSLSSAAELFVTLLNDAIKLRLQADVPVGSCLSGGLDSSSIVCLAHAHLQGNGRQKTFSACSHHKRYDERMHIEEVIKQTNIDAHYIYPDANELLEVYEDILWHQDEPYPTTSIYAQWLVFKLAKEKGVKVVLDGQGADELLGGYQGFFGNRLYELFMKGQWKAMGKEANFIKNKHPHINSWALLLNKLTPEVLRQPIRRLLGKSATGPDWLNFMALEAKDIHPFSGDKDKTVSEQSYQQLLFTNLPMLLHFEDRDSMAHSIESRTPFLDYRLVEFCLSLPSEYKVSEGWTKRVMRVGLNNTLPASICWRVDKMGFVTAEEEWVRRECPSEFLRLIEGAVEGSQGVLLPKTRTLAQEMISGKRPYDPVFWRQIAFSKWLTLFKCTL